MLKLLVWLLGCALVIETRAQQMLGVGKWTVQNVQRCEKDPDMVWKVDVRRRKLNRTHDAFDCDVDILDQLDESYAVRMDVCKVVDGGCKPYMTLKDDCLINFVKKYAQSNLEEAMILVGIDPPQFPVAKGDYHLKQYVLNMEDLPRDGLYGEYGVESNVVKDGVDLACAKSFVKYAPLEEYDVVVPSLFGQRAKLL